MSSTLAFAFGAGMVSTVNPCGFAMLPAFLAYYVGTTREDMPQSAVGKLALGLRTGAAVSAGFVAVFTVVGLLVAAGLRFLIGAVPWFAVAIGVVLVLLGPVLAFGGRLPVKLNANRLMRGGDGPRSMMTFGAAYAVASLSCTLAVLLAVIGSTLASSSVLLLLGVFAAYGAGASTILLLLTVSTALASGALERGLRRVARYIDRVAGAILALSGAYLIAYWVPVLLGARPNGALSGSTSGISGQLQTLVGGNIGLVTSLSAIAVGSALLVLLIARLRGHRAEAGATEGATANHAADGCCAPAADEHPATEPQHVR
jgi:cytochrome c-type biogenesis protein